MATQASVASTMQRKGFPMTLTRVVPGEYDPIAGDFDAGATQTWTVHGIVKPFSPFTIAVVANQGGSLIKKGDLQAIIGATVEPQPDDTLTVRGKTWKVLSVDPVSPQGDVLLYKLHLRR